MKNRFLLLAWCCLSLLLAGCQERRVYKIGVSQCSSDDWRNKCNEEIYREMIFHPDAEVEIRSAEDNNDRNNRHDCIRTHRHSYAAFNCAAHNRATFGAKLHAHYLRGEPIKA